MEKLTAIEVVDDYKREKLKYFLYKHWPDTIEVINKVSKSIYSIIFVKFRLYMD